MICLAFSQSRFCVATVVFYTCIWIPLFELKKALTNLLGMVFFFFFTYHDQQPLLMDMITSNTTADQPWLPISRFVDLQQRGTCQRRSCRQIMEETCSICLAEFEEQDAVSQLSKCGHVFHMNCIEKWLDCSQFTCPLCRSSFLDEVNTNSYEKPSLDEINPYIPSYLGFSWH